MGQSCTTSFDLPLSSLAPYRFIFEWKHRQIMQNQVHLCFWRWLDQEVHLNLPYLEQSTGQMPSLKSLIDFAMVILFAWICFPIFTCLVCLLFLLPLWLTSPWSLCAQFSCSVMSDCNPMDCSTPSLSVHQQLLEFAQAHVHLVNDAIQPSHPLSSPCPLPSIFPSIKVFSNESVSLHQLAKVLEFQLQHQFFQWIFRTSFLQDGLVGSSCSQGTLKCNLQNHSSKALILWCSAFFIVSHPYMTTGKTIALTRRTFVGTPVSMHIIKKKRDNKCWKECGEKRTHLHCWWECKLV